MWHLWSFRETNARENKLDKGEGKMSQRMRITPQLENIFKVSIRIGRASQSEAERSQLESIILQRSLNQNS